MYGYHVYLYRYSFAIPRNIQVPKLSILFIQTFDHWFSLSGDKFAEVWWKGKWCRPDLTAKSSQI